MALSARAMERLRLREELRATVSADEYRRIMAEREKRRREENAWQRRARYRDIWESILMVESWHRKNTIVSRSPANSGAFRKHNAGG